MLAHGRELPSFHLCHKQDDDKKRDDDKRRDDDKKRDRAAACRDVA